MARSAASWTLDVAMLAIVVVTLVWTVGFEFGDPAFRASALAPDLSAKLGIPEAQIRTELRASLSKWVERRILFRSLPLCALAGLLVLRSALERRRAPSENELLHGDERDGQTPDQPSS